MGKPFNSSIEKETASSKLLVFDEFGLHLTRAAIKKWGRDRQLDMVIEECAELTKAICKYRRQPNAETTTNIQIELVDVFFMLQQLTVMFPAVYFQIYLAAKENLARKLNVSDFKGL